MKKIVRSLLLITIAFSGCTSGNSTSGGNNSESSTSYTPSVQTSIGIELPDTSATNGASICLPVRAVDFDDIVSMQHSINWDPKILKFNSVQNFQMPSLSESNFGLTAAENGKIGISWYDPALKGMSLPDRTILYDVCFDVVGSSGSETAVRITSDPVVVEVSNKEERILGIPTGKGRVKVQ